MSSRDLTPETRIRFTVTQLWSLIAAIVVGVAILVRAHASVISQLDTMNQGIQALVEVNKKIDEKFQLYSLKKSVAQISVYMFRELHKPDEKTANEKEFKEEVARILSEQ